MESVWILVILGVLVCFVHETRTMKDVQVIVPYTTKIHDAVRLQCKFDLEGEPLYTVQWYKGNMEFFRYIPREDPKMQIFPVPGINIDLSRSSQGQIVLLDVSPETSGKFRCDVCTDAPNFETRMASAYLHVVDIPDSGPILSIERDDMGTIRANCTTPPAYLRMNVTWFINGVKVPESSRRIVDLDPLRQHHKTRVPYMTVSHVEKEVDFDLSQNHAIKVQCVASMFNLYKSSEVRYVEVSTGTPERIEANQIMLKSDGARYQLLTETCRFIIIVICILSTV